MIEIILIVLLVVLLLGGGGWMWYGNPTIPTYNPISIVLLILVLLLIFGLLGPRLGLYRW